MHSMWRHAGLNCKWSSRQRWAGFVRGYRHKHFLVEENQLLWLFPQQGEWLFRSERLANQFKNVWNTLLGLISFRVLVPWSVVFTLLPTLTLLPTFWHNMQAHTDTPFCLHKGRGRSGHFCSWHNCSMLTNTEASPHTEPNQKSANL